MWKLYNKNKSIYEDTLMKSKYQRKQLVILINQLVVITFLFYEYLNNIDTQTSSIMPLTIISIMVIGSAYIQFSNFKANYVLSEFSNLLLFLSWVFLLLRSSEKIFILLALLLYIFLPYKIIQFLLMFIFQDCIYTNKKQIDIILKTSCLLTLVSMFNNRLFSIMFMLQWLISSICFFYVVFKHRNRIYLVLKQEMKNLICSLIIIIIPYIIYISFFKKDPQYMDNIGLYIGVALPLFSIHGVVRKNQHDSDNYFILNYKMNILFSISLISFIVIIGTILHFNVISYFLLGHSVALFVLFYLTLLYSEMKQIILSGNHRSFKLIEKSFYMNNILQIFREEEMENDFSNYLHDEVLQDLLSIKNIIHKSDKPEVKEIIVKTLDNLNNSIREQMQEYHPIMLQTLTIKENFNNLIDMIKETYLRKNIMVSFVCDDNLFLIQPYNLIIYRMLRELVTNAFKHAKCTNLQIFLCQKKEEVELVVEDDGVGLEHKDKIDIIAHKGLASIEEKVRLIGGKIIITSREPSGLHVNIKITMRGDNSYEYFINR